MITKLTPREQATLREIARGSTNAEIAATLGMSVNTVRAHLRAAYFKIGAVDRTHAATMVVRRQCAESSYPQSLGWGSGGRVPPTITRRFVGEAEEPKSES